MDQDTMQALLTVISLAGGIVALGTTLMFRYKEDESWITSLFMGFVAFVFVAIFVSILAGAVIGIDKLWH